MAKQLDLVKKVIEGVTLNLKQHGKESSLPHCLELIIAPGVFLCSGMIDSEVKATQYYSLARQLDNDFKQQMKRSKFAMRLVSCQLAWPETEWDFVSAEHAWMVWLMNEYGLSAQIAHILVPTKTDKPTEKLLGYTEGQSEFYEKAMDQLTSAHNIEAWEMYAFWVTEEIENTLEKFSLDLVDTYTLEGHFKNYIHETRATLARNVQMSLSDNILKAGALRNQTPYLLEGHEDIIELEKKIMKARNEGKHRLRVQYENLVEIEKICDVIKEAHPNLTDLNRKTKLLTRLMGQQLEIPDAKPNTWEQFLFLMQLLHEEMGILSTINCNPGMERIKKAFGIQAAASLLKRKHGVDLVIEAGLNWGSPDPKYKEIFDAFKEITLNPIFAKYC